MKLASHFGHHNKVRKLAPDKQWPLPKCAIGLEWEFENGIYLREVMARDKSGYFQIHDDGSLRDQGVEIVTSGDGLWGEDLTLAFSLMEKAIMDTTKQYGAGGTPVCNYRTGFHVHLDVRDLEEKELHNLLMLYCVLERPIFNFVGKDRYNSNFCVPWLRSDAQFDVLKDIELIDEKTVGRIGVKIKQLQRYSALNCQSIYKFGTLEFRHMENALEDIGDQRAQKAFVRLIMHLKRLAVERAQFGLSGQAMFESLKQQTPGELMRAFGMNLPTQDWDYPEALMHSIGLVNFKLPNTKPFFIDAQFDKFIGKHPNWK